MSVERALHALAVLGGLVIGAVLTLVGNLLADLGYDPQFGARPLKRVIQKEVVNELAKRVLSGDLVAGEEVIVDADAQGFTFNSESVELRTDRKEARKKDNMDDLKKATDDLEDAIEDIETE